EELILELINKNKKFSIGIIDIDNFKNINDTYGHIYGDEILEILAHKVKDGLDENDIVIRFGGEEFIIVFLDNEKISAKEKLDKIRYEVNNIVFDKNIILSFSGGIKEWDNTEINKVIEEADKLLYKAKKEGKNKVLI
ncbi:MAG: GGDEF domain-containing protein, partial [Clostridium sp.]